MTNEWGIRMDIIEPELPQDKPLYRVEQNAEILLMGGFITPDRKKALRHARAILTGRLALVNAELGGFIDDQEPDPMDEAKAHLTRQGGVA